MTHRERLAAYLQAMREKPTKYTQPCSGCPKHYEHPEYQGTTFKHGGKVKPGKHYCLKFGRPLRIDGRMLSHKYSCAEKIIL